MQDNGGAELAGGLAAGGVMLFAVLIGLISLALFIWALIDAIKNRNLTDTERLVWILVIVFVGCIGPILYLVIGRKSTPRGPTSSGPPV